MRKPINLTKLSGFSANFNNTNNSTEITVSGDANSLNSQINQQVESIKANFDDNQTELTINLETAALLDSEVSIEDQEMEIEVSLSGGTNSNPSPQIQPDWTQDNEKAPDYIKNKEIAEQYRPVYIDGIEALSHERTSGPLNLASGDGIQISKENDMIVISALQSGSGGDAGSTNIPIATAVRAGLVKSSNKNDSIKVLQDGTMEINSVNVNRLYQTKGDILILTCNH